VAETVSERRLEQLRSIPIFSDLPADSLSHISTLLTESTAPAGYVLIQQNQPGSGLFILEDGTVTVERPGRRPISLGAGEFIGDLALLIPDMTHKARVRAKTDIRFLAISRPDFGRLLDEEPRIAVAMLTTLARRLARALEG
jgi:CRP/FNR family transcriptional regulator, cyclic AMP receptor protein